MRLFALLLGLLLTLPGQQQAGFPRTIQLTGELTDIDHERLFERAFTVPPGTRRIEVAYSVSGAERRTVVDRGPVAAAAAAMGHDAGRHLDVAGLGRGDIGRGMGSGPVQAAGSQPLGVGALARPCASQDQGDGRQRLGGYMFHRGCP